MNRDRIVAEDLCYLLNHLSAILFYLFNIFIVNTMSLLLLYISTPMQKRRRSWEDFDEVEHYLLKFKFPGNYVELQGYKGKK